MNNRSIRVTRLKTNNPQLDITVDVRYYTSGKRYTAYLTPVEINPDIPNLVTVLVSDTVAIPLADAPRFSQVRLRDLAMGLTSRPAYATALQQLLTKKGVEFVPSATQL